MFHHDHDTFSPAYFGTRILGLAIGAVSLVIALIGILAGFVWSAQPVISVAVSTVGELGVAFGLALIWAGERGIGVIKLTAFLAFWGIVILAWGATAMFGIDWITNTFHLDTPAGDWIVQVLFLFGVIAPWIVLFVAGAKWIQRRPQD